MKIVIVSKSGLNQPHHVVLVGDNGEPLMHSENYVERRDAEHLVALLRADTAFASLEIEYITEPRA